MLYTYSLTFADQFDAHKQLNKIIIEQLKHLEIAQNINKYLSKYKLG